MTARREDQPTTPLGELAAAMLAVIEAAGREDIKAIVMLNDESDDTNGMVALGGYSEDGGDIEAISDLFLYLKAVMEANGRTLEILATPDSPESL
jgi:hypothetical protein